MVRIGITGQNGFIGGHLYNSLRLFPDEFELIEFHRDYFANKKLLNNFVSNCDVIVHLAAINSHNDAEVYRINLNLINNLIAALEDNSSTAHVLFSSSLQEERDTLFAKSKKTGRELLDQWSKRSGGKFTGLIIPNVYGPFGLPHYNSFIATFSYQLIRGIKPIINSNAEVNLIYINNLTKIIIDQIRRGVGNTQLVVGHTDRRSVSEVLFLLENYQKQYVEFGIIPILDSTFEINLFNTFRSYLDVGNYFPVKFHKHTDSRGTFIETMRLNIGGQVSFSTSVPGSTRGNHFHTRKIERFVVLRGQALIKLRKIGTSEIFNFELSGDEPAYVDMPVWYTHNIKNIGTEELYTMFWINEFFDENDSDTYFEPV